MEVLDAAPDVLERLWDLWMQLPLLGTFEIPVYTTTNRKTQFGTAWVGKQFVGAAAKMKSRATANQAEKVRSYNFPCTDLVHPCRDVFLSCTVIVDHPNTHDV